MQSVQKSNLTAKYLFIAPPTEADLEKRLRGRGTETDEKIQVRLNNAKKELEFGRTGGHFDKLLVNDNVEECFASLVCTLQGWFPDMPLE